MKASDGWVSMETMLKFKRLSDLSSDPTVILTALKKSKTGQILHGFSFSILLSLRTYLVTDPVTAFADQDPDKAI